MKQKLEILYEVLGTYHRESKTQYLFRCPACHSEKRKLAINLERGGKCWLCDTKSSNLRYFVKRFGTYEQLSIWDEITGHVDLADKPPRLLLHPKPQEPETEEILNLPKEFKTLTSKELTITDTIAFNYLKKRNLTRKDVLRWKIGYAFDGDFAKRIIIPSFNLDGRLNYFVSRTYEDAYPKYKNPPRTNDIIFNELFVDFKDDLVVVEGVFDAIVAGNAVPLLTSTLRDGSKLFNNIVRNNTRVFLAIDPDAWRKEIKIIKLLLAQGIEVYKIDVEPFEDVGSMSQEEFSKRKSEAKMMTQNDLLLHRMRL